ncbi:MAG: STAS domain-containing protein [Candidatus Omnitrophica bacterium]|nr:STAS domain-containing protein [Candidatus Omnitrophota bacterium]MBU1128021.1 STAS domain-containing protein [Candidatus Omnitrophota bacterium]MBU1784519.1 STAS domain-containing protein [Candidatus Omnitrophota bacterium]
MEYFSKDHINDVTIVRFRFKEISIDQREELKMELDELLKTHHDKYVFNVAQIGFFTSLMIATTLFFAKELTKKDGEIKLCSLSDEAMDVLRLTRLDRVFEAYATEQEAVESFQG